MSNENTKYKIKIQNTNIMPKDFEFWPTLDQFCSIKFNRKRKKAKGMKVG